MELQGKVVVITGASSGIGRTTARRFAREGAKVVLAARNAEELERLGRELGGDSVALAVPTDVTDDEAMNALAVRAAAHFGGIDVWVNNAAVGVYGKFENAPHDVYKHSIETNLFGYMHGAWAALPHLRRSNGTLIDVISVQGKKAGPYASAYAASKWALRGFDESLRAELGDSEVKVVSILPAAIDTPFFQHAANYFGRKAIPPKPINDPEVVADAILSAAKRPKREVLVGKGSRQQVAPHALSPALDEKLSPKQYEKMHFGDEATPPDAGIVQAPSARDGYAERGGWQAREQAESGGPGKKALAAAAGAAAGAAAIAGAVIRRR
jgi:NAD(P)-dependent dehydrogenase (short-subunit alcohol dehydrogenase family)